MDDVTYATITVAFSQPEQVFMQTIINPEYVTSLPFNTRVHEAINSGSATLSEIAVALISIWPLILLSVAGWIIYRKMRQRKVNPVIRPA